MSTKWGFDHLPCNNSINQLVFAWHKSVWSFLSTLHNVLFWATFSSFCQSRSQIQKTSLVQGRHTNNWTSKEDSCAMSSAVDHHPQRHILMRWVQMWLWDGMAAAPARAMPMVSPSVATPRLNSLCSGATWNHAGRKKQWEWTALHWHPRDTITDTWHLSDIHMKVKTTGTCTCCAHFSFRPFNASSWRIHYIITIITVIISFKITGQSQANYATVIFLHTPKQQQKA